LTLMLPPVSSSRTVQRPRDAMKSVTTALLPFSSGLPRRPRSSTHAPKGIGDISSRTAADWPCKRATSSGVPNRHIALLLAPWRSRTCIAASWP